MTQLREVTFEECAANALITEIAGVPIRYINLAALRKTKAATNRPQDVQDLENLPPA